MLTSSRSPESDPTTAYAKAVVAGKIVAGQLVIAAARRHLRDLKDGARRGLVWRGRSLRSGLGRNGAGIGLLLGRWRMP